jgi:hypothetical protein
MGRQLEVVLVPRLDALAGDLHSLLRHPEAAVSA